MTNEALQLIRQRRRRPDVLTEANTEEGWAPEFPGGHRAGAAEHLHMVWQAISELPTVMKEVVTLFAAGYEYKEIAEMLDVDISTVRSHVSSARSRLPRAAPPDREEDETAPGIGADMLSWLHEQGKRRSEVAPEFDVEETLLIVRAADASRAGNPGGTPMEQEARPKDRQAPSRLQEPKLEIVGRLATALAELSHNRGMVRGWRPAESAAHKRGQRGDPASAAVAFARIVADQQRVLGPDHPGVLSARHYAAYWRGEAGDAAGAAAAFAELLADRVRVLGPYHLDTLATRHNFAVWRGKAGDAAGALAAFTDLLTDQQIALGPRHPDVLLTHCYIAKWRGEVGDAVGAAAAFTELLPHMVSVYGSRHDETLAAQANLAYWRRQSGTS